MWSFSGTKRNPISWFHPKGIYRVLGKLVPRLPDVSGCLFLTFTFNPALYSDPLSAFEHGRDKLRRVFFALRKGVTWEGIRYVIDEPYAVKVEFHANGWAHFHVVFKTHRFIPAGLISALWGLGRTNVRRISNKKFRYLLKYVTKGGNLPEWVLGRSRLRVFQSSHGFLAGDSQERIEPAAMTGRTKRQSTLGERLERWRKTALFQSGERFQQVVGPRPFFELVADLVFPAAKAGRYLGGGHFRIDDATQLEPWIA